MLTVKAFYSEVSKAGFKAILDPASDNGYADPNLKIIMVGLKNRTLLEAAIVGLHELGHFAANAFSPARRTMLASEASFYEVYADELAAWAWALAHVAPEDLPTAERMKAHALGTYAEARTVRDQAATARPEPPRRAVTVTAKKITDFVRFA